MHPEFPEGLSIHGLQKRLQKDLGLPSRPAAIKPHLTDLLMKKRLAFARSHREWTVDQWKNVVWSDESTFRIMASHCAHVIRPRGHRYDHRYTVKTVKHSPSVIVWDCFSGKVGCGGLYFLAKDVTMNAECYMNVWDNYFVKCIKLHFSWMMVPHVTLQKRSVIFLYPKI